MQRYAPATPRKALGAIACALTIATLSLLVAGPAALVVRGDDGIMTARTAVPYATSAVRILPSEEIVARRDARPATIGMNVVKFVHKLLG